MARTSIEIKRLVEMIRLGRRFLLPNHPTTYKEVRRYRRVARRSLIEIYGSEHELLERFERQFRHATRPDQLLGAEHGTVEKELHALDAAGTDAVEALNQAALEGTLDVIREAIRRAQPPKVRASPNDSPAEETQLTSEASNSVGAVASEESVEIADRRALIQGFIDRVSAAAGRRFKRKDIWTFAGYAEATEFERFQRNDPRTTKGAELKFNRVLSLSPTEFLKRLEKRHSA
jgi:hypothetical protein